MSFFKQLLAKESEEIKVPEEGTLPETAEEGTPAEQPETIAEAEQEAQQDAGEQAEVVAEIDQTQEDAQQAAVAEAEAETQAADQTESSEEGAAEEGETAPEAQTEEEDITPAEAPAEDADPMNAVEEGDATLDTAEGEIQGQQEEAEKIEKAVVTLESLVSVIENMQSKYAIGSESLALLALERVEEECAAGKGKKAQTSLVAAKEAHNRFTLMIAKIFDRILDLVGALLVYLFRNTGRLRKSLQELLRRAGATPNTKVHIEVTKRMAAASLKGHMGSDDIRQAGAQGAKALHDVSGILKNMAQELTSKNLEKDVSAGWYEAFQSISSNGMIMEGVFGVNLFQHQNEVHRPSLVASPIQLMEKGATYTFPAISSVIDSAFLVLDALDKCEPDMTAVMRLIKQAGRGAFQVQEGEAEAAAFAARARVMQHSLSVVNQSLFGGAYRYATAVARITKEYIHLASVGSATLAAADQAFGKKEAAA